MTEKYGLVITHTDNLGDEIQSIAVKRFLPSVDYYLDRDKINSAATPTAESIRAVLNGWWCHSPENWPPFSALVPLFVSFHLSPFRSPSLGLIPSEIFTAEPVANYLRTSGPVGARDLGTLDILRKAKIECYFSGCMTLTLERRDTEREGDLIVLNDVPDEVAKLFKSRTRKRVVRTQHAGHAQKAMKERFEQAERMLELYSSASCVITTRLHCALPCVAMETPVLLLDTAEDPKRFAGLSDFMHHLTIHEIASSASAYDLDRPPSNPGKHLPYRDALINVVTGFVAQEQIQEAYRFNEAEHVKMQRSVHSKVGEHVSALRAQIRTLQSDLANASKG